MPVGGEAKHDDREIDKLYRARRKAATEADWAGTSYKRTKGWMTLEQVERELEKVDPDGEWRREGYDFDVGAWVVKPALVKPLPGEGGPLAMSTPDPS